jgi:hypothetical protein
MRLKGDGSVGEEGGEELKSKETNVEIGSWKMMSEQEMEWLRSLLRCQKGCDDQ